MYKQLKNSNSFFIPNYFFMFFYNNVIENLTLLENTESRSLPPTNQTHLNFRLTDEHFVKVGSKTQFKQNIAAIKLLHKLEKCQKVATLEQQNILATYAGWGGLSQAFDPHNKNWHSEYTELKGLLSLEEYKAANESVLTAFYTPKNIIDGMYSALKHLGFTGGTILEPAMGTGNFIGLLSQEFSSKMYGVELDFLTGKIAQHLYPTANIQIMGFEKTSFPDGHFDAVITNVPFGSFKIHDKKFDKHNLYIHDYFILKSLDTLRDGGIAAFITTKGTMDKTNNSVRTLFAQRTTLLGAVRLPNTAFKEHAGTKVAADILFFQAANCTSTSNLNWLDVGLDASGVPINQYYIDNPKMVLGTMRKGISMYGGSDETYCEFDGRDLKTALLAAIQNLPRNVYLPPNSVILPDIAPFLSSKSVSVEYVKNENNAAIKNHCYGIVDGNVYLRQGTELIPQKIPLLKLPKLKTMIQLRTLVRHILQMQVEDCSDEILSNAQYKLNTQYEHFVRQYGTINRKENKALFRDDADYTLLLSLEKYDDVSGRCAKNRFIL